MHKFFNSPANVLAIKLSGTITGDDLEAIMDRVEDILAHHSKIHVFVETREIDGLQLSALPQHLSRSLPMFGQLHRFGRVAVVADQAWMRLATRIESAMLPYVSYRVFDVDEREEALAFIEAAERGSIASARRHAQSSSTPKRGAGSQERPSTQ